MKLQVNHDPEANALYVLFSDRPYAFGEDIDHERRIDYTADGTPIGVELLCVDRGVDLTGLPHADRIAEALRPYDIRILV
jgi:uncharacterized protein YuzE